MTNPSPVHTLHGVYSVQRRHQLYRRGQDECRQEAGEESTQERSNESREGNSQHLETKVVPPPSTKGIEENSLHGEYQDDEQ
jgi:hypothetical protein